MSSMPRRVPALVCFVFALALQAAGLFFSALPALAQDNPNPDAPSITKVEPPNWWVNLTPDVMLLLTGKNLQVTHANCNLPDVIVSRTQSTADGHYLFVWLKLNPNLKSGTAVCRVTTPKGQTSFELPLASRKQILARNQGLSLDDVLYLIMPDRFADGDPANDEPAEFPGSHDRAKPRAWHGGDLRGVQDHLAYLKDLGITTVWLTPIVKNGATQDYHGYGAVDLYAVDPHLGTLQDYQDLVAAAHKLHMKVFFDVVPNHVGPLHPWITNPPTPDWFHGTANDHLSSASPLKPDFYGQSSKRDVANDLFESLQDPHTPPEMRANLTNGWFFGILPDLNTENPFVVEYLIQNSIWSAISSGLDGFRIDTFPYVSRKFWEEWHSGLRKYYPRLSTIGEVFTGSDRHFLLCWWTQGLGRHRHATHHRLRFPNFLYSSRRFVKAGSGRQDRQYFAPGFSYPHPDFLVPFFANHDVSRFASMPGSSITKLKLAFALTLTLRGIPELYCGDEIAMPGGNDPDNRRDFPGGWHEDEKSAFTVQGRTPEQQEVFAYVQKLLRLRRDHAALRSGQLWHLSSDDTSYVFLRVPKKNNSSLLFTMAPSRVT